VQAAELTVATTQLTYPTQVPSCQNLGGEAGGITQRMRSSTSAKQGSPLLGISPRMRHNYLIRRTPFPKARALAPDDSDSPC